MTYSGRKTGLHSIGCEACISGKGLKAYTGFRPAGVIWIRIVVADGMERYDVKVGHAHLLMDGLIEFWQTGVCKTVDADRATRVRSSCSMQEGIE